MKIIGVACSGLDRSVSRKMIEAFLKGAEEAGHETELILIHQDLLGCTGCKGCKNKDSFCVRQDVLTHYFEALPEADAVVLGFGIYMGYPQGEAWTFMNRHYCLHKSFVGGECKIRPGKKLFCMVAQGAPIRSIEKTVMQCSSLSMAGASIVSRSWSPAAVRRRQRSRKPMSWGKEFERMIGGICQ